MQSPSGSNGPAADMIGARIMAAAMALCLGPLLGSCGGVTEGGFSGYVADHWPHWAGGMPDDVPPRPGTPGYAEFIAHGQPSQDAANSVANGEKPVFSTTKTAVQPASAAQAAPAAPTAPVSDGRPEDSNVAKGGLY